MRSSFFWAPVTVFFVGVAVASIVPLGSAGWMGALVLASALFVCVALFPRSTILPVVAIAFVSMALGMARMDYAITTLPDTRLAESVGEQVVIEGFVQAEPDERAQTVRLNVRADTLAVVGETYEVDAGVLVVARAPFAVAYKDRVRAEGKLAVPDAFETETGRVFDYPHYLAKEGIAYEVEFPETDVVANAPRTLRGSLFALKQKYLSGLAATLPEPHASLAGGITVGDKRSLGDELLEQFRQTGIIHIVVLSGYNLTIISDNVLRMLASAPRGLSVGIGAAGIVAFAVMTGGSASIVRASIMALLALLARATERRYAITRALALAAAGMVLWEPHVLLYDPGFQLSVLATLGLIHVAPILEGKWTWIPESFGLRSIVAATLGTQLFVLPLLLYQMGFVSLVAVPVNLLVLVTVPYAMFFSFVAGVLGAIFGTSAVFVGVPAFLLLSYAFWVVDLFADTPVTGFSIPQFSFLWVVGAYAVLGVWLWRHHKKEDAGAQ